MGRKLRAQVQRHFAFAVWQQNAGTLFLARDRCGVKPLFYTQAEDSLIFGSELKTLLAHPAVPPRVDANGLAEVLLLGPGRTPGCGVFQNVRELLPGQYAVYETQTARLTLHTFWRLEDHDHPDDFAATARRVRDLVTDAIERQLVSDVPVATFLSGGLDSSLISAIADAHFTAQGNQLQTFSVGYRDNKKYFHATKFQPGADAPYIRKMNDFLHARHHWVTLDTPELVPALYAAVDARDLPGMADVDASLLVFCRHIKPHATVALSGSARTKFSAATRGTATPRCASGTASHGRSPRLTARRSSSPVCWAASTRQRSWMNAIAPRWHRPPSAPACPPQNNGCAR